MMRSNKNIAIKVALLTGSCLSFAFSPVVHAQTAVDLELALLLDGSGSVGSSNFQLQLDAYKNIFTDPNFYDEFINPLAENGGLGQIAVSAWQFASGNVQEIGWTLIDDQADATTFGNAFSGITYDSGGTNTTGAINGTTTSILNNAFDGERLVIDISTDGVPNNTTTTQQAAASSIAAGVDTINAIGVGSGINLATLEDVIIAGEGAFALTASNFAEFETALDQKLETEIVDGGVGEVTTPEPNTILGLLGLSTFAMTFTRKRKQA